VTEMEGDAFYNCNNLTNLTVGWKKPLAIDDSFADVPSRSCILHVPAGTKALYRAANGWKKFKTIVEYK
jgi:hypothetical protein